MVAHGLKKIGIGVEEIDNAVEQFGLYELFWNFTHSLADQNRALKIVLYIQFFIYGAMITFMAFSFDALPNTV